MGLELDYIFHPRSIAVAGASVDPEKRGHSYVDSLLYHGFSGRIYPINPRGEDVLGQKAYRSLDEISGTVDYVISSVPSSAVLDLVDAAARKRVKAIHFFTARFSETGHEKDIALERELLKRASAAGIRVIGPNCMGIYYPKQGMSFMRFEREAGNVGILSQSGGNVHEIVYLSSMRGLRFSKAVSFGNAFDINESDLLDYFTADPETEVIGGYVEGVRDGPRFARALREAAATKPVVLLKGGRTQAGTRAVASHTASLAGSREIWRAVATQSNVVLVETLEELCDMLIAFRFCKPSQGHRVGVIGGGGGRSVEAADSCESVGLVVEPMPQSLRETFKEISPTHWDWVSNPVDGSILPGSGLDERVILKRMALSGSYDLFITNARELWSADSASDAEKVRKSAEGYFQSAEEVDRPLVVVQHDIASGIPWQDQALVEIRRAAIDRGVAMFPSVRRAALALSRLATYYRNRNNRSA